LDTLAHGLWGGAAFGQRDNQWKWAFLWGVCPDLFSFGPFFLTHMGDIGERWAHHHMGPPDPRTIPAYVYHAYNVTHSLVAWSLAAGVLWFFCRRPATLAPWLPRPDRSPEATSTGGPYTRRVSGRSRAFSLWPFGSWGLHILCDIPTHSLRFFPTPYLWPLPTPFYNGHSWGNRTFMLANYAGIALAYLVLAYRQSKWTES